MSQADLARALNFENHHRPRCFAAIESHSAKGLAITLVLDGWILIDPACLNYGENAIGRIQGSIPERGDPVPS